MRKELKKHKWLTAVKPVTCLMTAAACLYGVNANAQLSSNPDKFLGNITTRGQVDYGSEKYYTLWNQITPENESKWSSIEGNRDNFNWGGCDASYNYAKQHNFPFKFHTLVWGSQYPGWMDNLSTKDQYEEIVEWMDAIKKRYPQLDMIDVVNEAVPGHAPAPYKAALGGDGVTGYDWIIKAFEMAHERWPDAILIYNDYNTFQWQKNEFIHLVKTLRDAGAPIDAYGCQSHDVTDMSFSNFKAAMDEIQRELKMPMYSSEYDIGTTDDALQLQRYKEQIPYMWEADYCAGITLWGYIYGATWTTDGNSGIIRDGKDRPAMKWLREYMQTDAAKNAKSPFPGMVKEASVYIKPATTKATINETLNIAINASLKTKTIDHIDFYIKGQLHSTLTEAPYVIEYTPTATGRYDLKAVVVATDSTEYERLGGFSAYKPRSTYKGEIAIPGTLQAENFDSGADGIAFHDSDTKDDGNVGYRKDNEGVDIVSGNGGYAIGYTSSGEWLEYTVNVAEAGIYAFEATVSSGVTNSGISLALSTENGLVELTKSLTIPSAGSNNWDTYSTIYGRLAVPLEAGKQIIRLNITGSNCNVDKIVFKKVSVDKNIKVAVTANPNPATVGVSTKISIEASSDNGIASVKLYQNNGVLLKNITTAPYEYSIKPSSKGTLSYKVIAIDSVGNESEEKTISIKVNPKRTAYKTVSLPGTIQAENFDKGGADFTFHDSDTEDEGGAGYRSDNEGVDIVTGNGGHAIGYTANGEWLEYTVNVKTPGEYSFTATVSSGNDNSGFSISLVDGSKVTTLANVKVPKDANGSWDNYTTVKGKLSKHLDVGKQIIRITITGAYCNIDKIQFTNTLDTDVEMIIDTDSQVSESYNLYGIKVDSNYKGIVVKDGEKILNR
ncbi:MAG: endo-1,4-beta-xylanase [Bacteroidaceae bacterium]|nr:endo-1,4-beta-xylanase [Bacteroidaceae bacterium]